MCRLDGFLKILNILCVFVDTFKIVCKVLPQRCCVLVLFQQIDSLPRCLNSLSHYFNSFLQVLWLSYSFIPSFGQIC